MARKTFEMLSDSLTPDQVKNKEFGRSALGYSRHEVVEFLDSVSKSWEKVQRRERELIDEIKTLNEEIDRLNRREQEIEVIKEQARKEAESYFVEARSRSEEIRGKTEEWLASLISQVEETERRRNSFLTAFKSALDQHYQLLNTDLEKNQGLENQLAQFLSSMSQTEMAAEAADKGNQPLI